MKKRLLAAMLVISTLLQLGLSGCKKNADSEDPTRQTITNGEFLTMVCDAFGMYDYTNNTPYLKSVSTNDPYFSTVQMCVEWDIISADAQDYDVNAKTTRGEMALALVNAAVLTDLESSDDEKLETAIKAELVPLRNGKLDKKATVSREEAENSIALAVDLWANKEFTQNIQEVIFHDSVVDLTSFETMVREPGIIYVPVSAGQIKSGDAFVYNSADMGWTAAKAESVVEENGYYIITESNEDFELEDIVTDIVVQETYTPNLAAFPFTDGNGVVYKMGATNLAMTDTAPTATYLLATPTYQIGAMQTASSSWKYPFKIDGVDVEVEIKGNSVKVGFKTPISEDKKGNQISGISGSLELSNIKLTNDIDYKVFGGLKSLVSKINYNVKIQGGVSTKWVEKICAPYNNGNGYFLTNLMRTNFLKTGENGWRDISDKGASKISGKQITIGSWPLVEGGLAQVKLELKLNFSITGEVTATLELSGAKGIEYRNGNLRIIKEMSADKDLQFKCKAELTAGPGITLKLLNKWEVAGVSAKLGIGVEASATVHMIDAERHLIETYEQGDDGELSLAGIEANGSLSIYATPSVLLDAARAAGVDKIKLPEGDITLTTETCLEVRGNWILKLDVSILPFLEKIIKTKTKYSIDILSKDAANIFKYHVEDFDFLHPVSECTKEYTPFEYLDDGQDTGVGAKNPERLDLNAYLLVFNDDNSQTLEVLLSDSGETPNIIWTSDNPAVATVDQNGQVTPVGVGMTLIAVALENNPNVYVKCAVYVQETNLTNSAWEFLPADMEISIA